MTSNIISNNDLIMNENADGVLSSCGFSVKSMFSNMKQSTQMHGGGISDSLLKNFAIPAGLAFTKPLHGGKAKRWDYEMDLALDENYTQDKQAITDDIHQKLFDNVTVHDTTHKGRKTRNNKHVNHENIKTKKRRREKQ
jgi:hypothetical protein